MNEDDKNKMPGQTDRMIRSDEPRKRATTQDILGVHTPRKDDRDWIPLMGGGAQRKAHKAG